MTRHYVQLEADGTARAELYADRVPGSGPDLPADMINVTDEPGHETTAYAGVTQRVGETWVDLPAPPRSPTVADRLAAIETTLAQILAKIETSTTTGV